VGGLSVHPGNVGSVEQDEFQAALRDDGVLSLLFIGRGQFARG